MTTLHEHIAEIMRGGSCIFGLGNPAYGDDSFGVTLAGKLHDARVRDVITAGVSPERYLEAIAAGQYRTVLFLDAVEMGAAPGSAVLLSADEVKSRYPQVSTHKISLGTLVGVLEARTTRVYLLGVQPKSLKAGAPISAEVREAIENLYEVIMESHSAVSAATAGIESGE